MDEIIKVLRSLAISKNGTISISELVRDFKDNEGYWVEPKKYGFNDIRELLTSSNQFTFRNTGNTTLITVKPTEASAHVSNLVKLSKRPRGGRGRRRPGPQYIYNKQSSNYTSSRLRTSVSNNVYGQREQLSGYRQPSSDRPTTSYQQPIKPSSRLIQNLIPSLIPSVQPNPKQEKPMFQTRRSKDHYTVVKQFCTYFNNKSDIMKPLTTATQTPEKSNWKPQEQQEATPLHRVPNVINELLPKKCPWGLVQRNKVDVDKTNAFRSDLLDRFTIPGVDKKLKLPWNEKYWNFFITNVNGYNDISARLIGHEFSVQYDRVISEINQNLKHEMTQIREIIKNEIYILLDKEYFYRVNIIFINGDDDQFQCRLIDIGCTDWFPQKNLFICPDRFKTLPAQSIQIRLKNLKDYNDYLCTQEILTKKLLGKVFVGEILTSKPSCDCLIDTVLYDTSGLIDINMNSCIEDSICYSNPKPSLNDSMSEVIVSQVNDDGSIYCWVRKNGMAHIQKLIQNVMESKTQIATEENLCDSKKLPLLYLILSPHQMTWYRAVIQGAGTTADEYLMFCVDYGMSLSINKKEMWRVDRYSVALSRYPYQAIQIRLYDVLVMCDAVVDKLKGLLAPGIKTTVKIVKNLSIPEVNMYLSIDDKAKPLWVNEEIRSMNEHNPVFHPADNTYRRPLDSPNSVCSSNNLLENNSDQCEIEGTIDNETEDKIQDLINEFDKLWRSKMTEKEGSNVFTTFSCNKDSFLISSTATKSRTFQPTIKYCGICEMNVSHTIRTTRGMHRQYFYCKLCKRSTGDEISFHGHLHGKRHFHRLNLLNGKHRILEKQNNFFCEICQIEIGGEFNYECHLNGSRHCNKPRLVSIKN